MPSEPIIRGRFEINGTPYFFEHPAELGLPPKSVILSFPGEHLTLRFRDYDIRTNVARYDVIEDRRTT